MAQQMHYPLNTPFKPAAALQASFIVNYLLVLLLIAGCVIIPMVFGTGADLLVIQVIGAGIILLTIVFVVWIRLYYESMWYELRDDEMSWKRGVWFRTTGIVPYNRITNLDIKQGPVMRLLGISTLALQTAGYSGQAIPEIRIEGVEHAEELRELLRNAVRRCNSAGDGTGTGLQTRSVDEPVATTGTSMLILGELKKIRMLLEQQQQK